ncbi:MAG: hypothetical protein BWY21_01535 [Parcubacteria group bacterium ADurb.Bin216]|nr:MAG: hypothetical protein BWY21_01535 [Parcubacteria group bacterium ADurb.Bin216]
MDILDHLTPVLVSGLAAKQRIQNIKDTLEALGLDIKQVGDALSKSFDSDMVGTIAGLQLLSSILSTK